MLFRSVPEFRSKMPVTGPGYTRLRIRDAKFRATTWIFLFLTPQPRRSSAERLFAFVFSGLVMRRLARRSRNHSPELPQGTELPFSAHKTAHFQRAPEKVNPGNPQMDEIARASCGKNQLYRPQDEETGSFPPFEFHIEQKKRREQRLRESKNHLPALQRIKHDWTDVSGAERKDSRQHRGQKRPLADVAGNQIHQRDRCAFVIAGPVESGYSFGRLGYHRRDPGDENRPRDPQNSREAEQTAHERFGDDKHARAPDKKQRADRRNPLHPGSAHNGARHGRDLVNRFGLLRRKPPHKPQIPHVDAE